GPKDFLRNSTLRGKAEALNGPGGGSRALLRPGGEKQVENVSGATQSTRAANWRNQGTMISLSAGRFLDDTKSRDTKSAEPQILALTVRASP
ncbi:hypothetical protein Prudu_017645, partial [Prunus dulcis]